MSFLRGAVSASFVSFALNCLLAGRKESSNAKLAELLVRVFADELPHCSEGASAMPLYTFREQDANLASSARGVSNAVTLLKARGVASRVLITDVENAHLDNPIPFWSGAPEIMLAVRSALGAGAAIEVIPFGFTDRVHTLREAQALVRYAKSAKLVDLVAIAPPFHLPRAFISTVSEALREYPSLRVWASSGGVLSWDEEASHSQGIVGVRRTFIGSELRRIPTYTAKGDLAPASQVLAYLKLRGGGAVTCGGRGAAVLDAASRADL